MSFTFADAGTEPLDLQTILRPTDEVTTEYIFEVSQARRRLCDALQSQPSSLAVLEAIEAYLPHLQRLMLTFDMAPGSESPKFKWRSCLSMGIRVSLVSKATEKPFIKVASIYWEGVSVLVAYGMTLMNLAAKRTGPSDQQANEAIDFYCRAAGVFKLAASTWAPRLPADGKKIPEGSVEVLLALSEQALSQAQLQALLKGERKSLSPATLLRLHLAAAQKASSAASYLTRLPKAVGEELSLPLRQWIEHGAIVLDAQCLQKHAILQQEAGQNGMAVGCYTYAYNALIPLTSGSNEALAQSPWRPMAASLQPILDEQARVCAKINNNVTYQPIPVISEARASLPSAASMVEVKAFNLPAAAELPKKRQQQ